MKPGPAKTTATVVSKDGTRIAYDRTGGGPALVLIDAALHYRAFSSFDGLVGRLAGDFTVYEYDRRGRGASSDTPPYSVEREVEDLAALVDEAGGDALLYGYSSGALLALHAAASGLPVARLAVMEPPFTDEEDRSEQKAFIAHLADLTARNERRQAVEFFTASIGVPDEVMAQMRDTPPWEAMEKAAPTLVYDSLISEASSVELLRSVAVPVLVLDSEGSSDDLTGMAATLVRALPNGAHRSLPGEWHGVPDDVLAPVLKEFFTD